MSNVHGVQQIGGILAISTTDGGINPLKSASVKTISLKCVTLETNFSVVQYLLVGHLPCLPRPKKR